MFICLGWALDCWLGGVLGFRSLGWYNIVLWWGWFVLGSGVGGGCVRICLGLLD